MQRRCDRNRKRSKKRAIYCPIHGCHLDSVSKKYALFADRPGQLQQRGICRRDSLILVASQTAVPLEGEWLEAFWCEECQERKWYHVHKSDCPKGQCAKRNRAYNISLAPPELWQQAMGVINAQGNPSVGEFTRRQARMVGFQGVKDFRFVS